MPDCDSAGPTVEIEIPMGVDYDCHFDGCDFAGCEYLACVQPEMQS